MVTRKPRHLLRAPRWVRPTLALVLSLLVVGAVVTPAVVAHAAGSAQLTVTIQPVDSAGVSQTTAGAGISADNLSYRVSYSCNVANCDGATIVVSGTPTDPNYGANQPLLYKSWTPPIPGSTIAPATGAGPQTINLGNLGFGAAGSFTINYFWVTLGSASIYSPTPASFFPNGFLLHMSATGNATSASAPVTAQAPTVSWVSTIPTPVITLASSLATAKTGGEVTYTIRMTSACLTIQAGVPKGNAAYTCAKSYNVVDHLPPQAVFVRADGGGVYHSDTNTVVWSQAPQAGALPAIGWASVGSSALWLPRTVTVTYPAASFSPSGTDASFCDFSQSVTDTVDMSMVYLATDPADDSNVRSLSATTSHAVTCVSPFPKGVFLSKQSTFTGPARLVGNTVSPVIVQPDANPSQYSWLLSTANQANVDGVAVITDNGLAVEGTRVTKISGLDGNQAVLAGSSIAWVRSDGATGTATTGTVTAPAGTWYTSAVVTSPVLAGPNVLATGTASTLFSAKFDYTVTANAPVGQRRTNTATAVMQYPGSGLPDLNLGSQTHTLEFEAPFGRGVADKTTTVTRTAGGVDYVDVPTTGSSSQQWTIWAYNTGNVPGVAVIEDHNLAAAAPVKVTGVNHQISAGPAANARLQYTLNTGATGTVAMPFTAPTGTWITDIKVTSDVLPAVNATTAQNQTSLVYKVFLLYSVPSTAPTDVDWTNTAQVTMTYPGMGVADVDLGSHSHLVRFEPTVLTPTLAAQFVGTPVVAGGGLAVPGRDVTYTVRGISTNVAAGASFSPQYVFLAPVNWTVTNGSAAFAPGTVPAGVAFNYRTVTVGTVTRSVVIASWPAGVTFGANTTWPSMTVAAQPTFAAAQGSGGVAQAWIGEASHNWSTTAAVYSVPVVDTPDIDGDGLTTDVFSSATATTSFVGAASQLSVIKEICRPDISSIDGCDWISQPDILVGVDPSASNIRYRIRLVNAGNSNLTNLVAYDVLPYIGDVGTSSGTASVPRNSTFAETLSSISNPIGVTVSYSSSTNPCRPEVYAAQPAGCDSTWTATAAGAKAMKISGIAALAPGASVSLQYQATVVAGAAADAIACNSVAVKVNEIGTPTEPQAVCATTQQADLELTVPSRLPLQVGRPGVVPFTVVNHGGSQNAPATVTVTIPADVRVTDLAPAGWSCVSSATQPDGSVVGPVTLECASTNADGTPRMLALEAPETVNVPVVPLAEEPLCFPGAVSGTMSDPVLTNNDAQACFSVTNATPAISLTKSDGLTGVSPGQQFTYTLTVQNKLIGEVVPGATITDTLPAGVVFVSATGGGVLSGVTAGQPGGTVTWALADLAQIGVAGATGAGTTGGAGSSASVTVTVKLQPGVSAAVTNAAAVSAPDPINASAVLTDAASDTDQVRTVSIAKTSNAPAIGATVGDTIVYTVSETNTGTADYTIADPASISDDLTGVLGEASFVAGSAKVKIGGGAATAVADPAAGVLTWSGALPVGSTAVLTYSVTVTSGVTALTNTAYSAAPSSCTAGIDTDGLPCATLTTPFAPVLSIVKTAHLNDANSNTTADAGETISYSFVVTNVGGSDATNVAVTDAKVKNIVPATASIPAGGSATFTADDYVVTQADVNAGGSISNTATASGDSAGGVALPVSDPFTATVQVTAANPALTIQKSADLTDSNNNGKVDVGETIAYHFVVTNTGSVTMHGISVTDTKLTNVTPTSVTLAPGEQQVFTADPYVGTQTDFDNGGTVTNTATTNGLDPSNAPLPVAPSSSTTTPLAAPAPSLSIVKTATLADTDNDGVADAGEHIAYSFVVENTGNVTEHGVTVADAKVKNISPAPVTLVPGEKVTFTADDYVVTQADVDAGIALVNTATATGTDPQNLPTVSAASTATTPIAVSAPGLSIVKTATLQDADNDGVADLGETITYTFAVTNTGNVTLTGVTPVDPKVTGIAPAPVTLAPGASQQFTAADYTVTQADVDAGLAIANTATAKATDPSGDPFTSDPSTATTPITPANPLLSIVKSGDLTDVNGNDQVDVGDTIAYTFVVTNTGNVTVFDISVDDPMVTGITPSGFTLAPGQQQVVTADPYVGTQTDVDNGGTVTNTASVTGIDPQGASLPTLTPSTVTIPLVAPAPKLSIVQTGVLNDTNGNGLADAGETITYTFVVTNVGNVTVHDVTVSDPMLTGIDPAPAAALAPGAQATFTAYVYTVTAADITNGSVKSVATASGSDPARVSVVSEDSTVITATAPVVIPGLAFTGANAAPAALLGFLLLAAGATLALLVRRRRTARHR